MSEQERVQIYIKYKETWFVTRHCQVFCIWVLLFYFEPYEEVGPNSQSAFCFVGSPLPGSEIHRYDRYIPT